MPKYKLLGQGLVLAIVITLSVSCAYAASQARTTLEEGVNKILDVLKSPVYVNPSTRQDGRKQIGNIVKQYFDFVEFSSRTVGPRWQQFTAKQQNDFSDAFGELLINTYVNKIDGYNGEKIAYVGERAGNERVEIKTMLTFKNGKKIPVDYRMLQKNGGWKVYDVLIENISLVKNYRTQFQSILTSSSPEDLIARIRAKATEANNKNAKP